MHDLDLDISTQAGGLFTLDQSNAYRANFKAAMSALLNTLGLSSAPRMSFTGMVNCVCQFIPGYRPPIQLETKYDNQYSDTAYSDAVSALIVDLKQSSGHVVPGLSYTFAELGIYEVNRVVLPSQWIPAAVDEEFHWGCVNGCIVIEKISFTRWFISHVREIENAKRLAIDAMFEKTHTSLRPERALPAALIGDLRRLKDVVAGR